MNTKRSLSRELRLERRRRRSKEKEEERSLSRCLRVFVDGNYHNL